MLCPVKNWHPTMVVRSDVGHRHELCSGERWSTHDNGHTRRDKDWSVGDSFPGLIPAEGKDSAASVAIFELDVPAGAKVPIAHRHDACEETIYSIEGIITFTLEGRTIETAPATRSASLDIPLAASTASTTFTPPHPKR